MAEKSLYSEVKKRKMEALGKAAVVKQVEQHGKVLSIKGQYDQPDKVTSHMYAAVKDVINPGQFNKVTLSNYDLVVIGCPGNEIPGQFHPRFREYVENGGWILSTDWVLRTIVEPLFPGYIAWNGEKTADAVVACEIVDPSHPFLDGVIDSLKNFKGGDDESNLGPKSYKGIHGLQPTFRWWLEDKSFPISVLRKSEVKVLIKSYEIEKKWGAAPVFVYFTFGKGLVAHFISHTHLQKGASKGKFASAIILTNLLDECVKWKYGGTSQRSTYQDASAASAGTTPAWNQGTPVQAWSAPQKSGQQASPFDAGGYQPYQPSTITSPYTMPSTPDPNQGVVPNFGGVAQATEIQIIQDPTKECATCGQNFTSYHGRVFECSSCHAMYHDECVQQQINFEGTCKKCNQVLLL